MTDATIGAGRPVILEFAPRMRRLGAAVLDVLILAVLGWLAAQFFAERLYAYGPYARLFGLPVSLLYFGVFNSRLGGGATPGKRALDLCVVGRDGSDIAPWRGLLRAVVYQLPFYLNGLDLSALARVPLAEVIAECLVTALLSGTILGTLYLFFANRGTRQLVHDLAAGSFVVRRDSAGRAIAERIARVHLVVVAALYLLGAAAYPLATYVFDIETPISDMLGTDFGRLDKVLAAVQSEPDVLSATVSTNTTTIWATSGSQTTTALIIIATHAGRVDNPEPIAARIAARVLAVEPDAMGEQRLTITVRYGYDIGIWSTWNGNSFSYTPDEWRALLAQGGGRQGQSAPR